MSVKNVFIESIKLTNYRNFSSTNLSFSSKLVSLVGVNGIGKTNILEAISLLSPGKGLRNNKLDEIQNYNKHSYLNGWGVKINFHHRDHISYQFVTSKTPENKNRTIYVNDNKLSKQQDLTKYLNIIWLTPADDALFLDSKSNRRKFFDRITFNLFPDHLQNLIKYEYYLKERLTILTNTNIDSLWLDNIEHKISLLISSITQSRIQTIKYLNAELKNLSGYFPKCFIGFDGQYEELYLNSDNAQDIEKKIQTEFLSNRKIDKEKLQTTCGIHKTDFKSISLNNNIAAKYCSTGEQKSLLISIIIAKARILKKYNNKTPILLLDEITSHLDINNATELLKEIQQLDMQCFFTGTNKTIFKSIPEIEIINITPSPGEKEGMRGKV